MRNSSIFTALRLECPHGVSRAYLRNMLLYFSDKLKRTGKATFSEGELSLILGVYGERVKRGEWRDYAIDSLPDMALFSVYRSAGETPLYAIAKIRPRSLLKPSQYAVYSGNKTLKQSSSLSDVLKVFEEKT